MTRGTNVMSTAILEDTEELFPRHNCTGSRIDHELSRLVSTIQSQKKSQCSQPESIEILECL